MSPARNRIGRLAIAAAAIALAMPVSAHARGLDRPGDFDFWVLSLSWSPSWCETNGGGRDDVQCARPYAFVVHGLWPQRERGWPADCPTGAAEPSPALVRSMLTLMPSPGLVRHEWRKHGTCSGLDAPGYFGLIRRIATTVRIPESFRRPDRPLLVSPAAVESAFIAANPGLTADAVAVDCDRQRLREVRLCLSRDLSGFRPCPEIDRRSCRLDRARMPAVRPGN